MSSLSLRDWRIRVLNGVLRGVFILWLIAIAWGIFNAFSEYRQNADFYENPFLVIVAVLTVYLGTTVLLSFITFSQKMKFELRAGILLFNLYMLGTIGMALTSFSGDGRVLFFAFITLTAIFFDLRYSLAAFIFTFLTMLVLGYLQVSGIMEIPVERQTNAAYLGAWMSGGVVLLVLSIAALLSITYLLRTFEQSLNETRTKAQDLSRLYEAAEDMAARFGDPTSLLEILAKHMTDALKATSTNIVSVDVTLGVMTVLAEHWAEDSMHEERVSDIGHVYQVKDYLTIMRPVISGRSVTLHANSNHLTDQERLQFKNYGVKSMLFVPIMGQGKLLGDAEIWESRYHREFSETEIRLAQAMASHAAAIIGNSQLFAETRQRERELGALLTVSGAVSSSLQLPDVLKAAATTLARLLQVDFCSLSDYYPDRNLIVTAALYSADGDVSGQGDLGRDFPLEGYPSTRRVLESGIPAVIRLDDPEADPAEIQQLRHDDMFTCLILPLRLRGQSLGLAELFSSDPNRFFKPEDIQFANALVDQVAVAIENARLYEKLEQREAYYRALFENSADGVAIIDAQGILRYLSPSEERLTGYIPHEIQGHSAFQYVHPQDLPGILEAFTEGASVPGSVRTVQYRLKRKDGEWRHFEITGRNMLDDPHIAGIVVNYRDVTERVIAEKALRDSEERFRTIFHSAGVPIWEDDYSALIGAIDDLKKQGVTDFQLYLKEHPEFLVQAGNLIKITDANDAVVKMMEAQDKAEVLGSLEETLKENATEIFARDIIAIAEGVTLLEHESFLYTLKGRRRDIWVSIAFPQRTIGYKRVLVSTLDITERKQAERALQESQSRLEGIINTALNAIITINKEQRIVLFNPFAEKVFGCSAEYAMGKSIEIFIPERYRKNHSKSVADFGITKESSRKHGLLDKLHGVRVNGEEFPMEAFISHHAIGDETYFTVILRDITERRRDEESLKHRAEELQTLVIVSSALRSALSVNDIIPLIVRYAVEIVGGALGTVYLLEESTGNLVSPGWFSNEQGEDIKVTGVSMLRHLSGSGITGHVVRTGQIYVTEDLHSDPFVSILPQEAGTLSEARSGISLPLLSREKVVGVLHVRLLKQHIFTETETRLLTAIAEMAGNALHRATLYEQTLRQADELAQAYDNTLTGWARALELRDELTEGHTRRVTELTLQLARSLNVPENELVQIRRGAILHDIGKMGIPDSILHKPGPLTPHEEDAMRLHPQYAYEMLSLIPFLRHALDIPYCHHERWDGNGYPRRLKEKQIPLAARIFSVVDVWDALTSDRPYRAAWSKEKAREYIVMNSGKYFDPAIVEKFIAMIET